MFWVNLGISYETLYLILDLFENKLLMKIFNKRYDKRKNGGKNENSSYIC